MKLEIYIGASNSYSGSIMYSSTAKSSSIDSKLKSPTMLELFQPRYPLSSLLRSRYLGEALRDDTNIPVIAR